MLCCEEGAHRPEPPGQSAALFLTRVCSTIEHAPAAQLGKLTCRSTHARVPAQVNNAGMSYDHPDYLETLSDQQVQDLIAINCLAPTRVRRSAGFGFSRASLYKGCGRAGGLWSGRWAGGKSM